MVFPEVGGTLNIYGGIFSEREEVILVATPNEFFEFVSWSGSEEGEDSIREEIYLLEDEVQQKNKEIDNLKEFNKQLKKGFLASTRMIDNLKAQRSKNTSIKKETEFPPFNIESKSEFPSLS